MMQEAIKSIKSQLYDRVTSPLFSTFTAATVSINHKFFIVLTSAETPKTKFELIESLYPCSSAYLKSFVLYPTVSAIIFLVVYPLLSAGVYWIWIHYQSFLQTQKQRLHKDRLISREESQAILQEIDTLREDYEQIISRNQSEIEALKNLKSNDDDTQKPKNENFQRFVNMMSGLSETERDEYDFVLAALRAEHPKPLTSLSIMKLAPKDLEHLDPANVDYIANTMKSYDIIQATGRGYRLTSTGLEFSIKWPDKNSDAGLTHNE
ncbi:hypothetical protein [uncultured Spongiibacter sp.]|uniref:hypothetical protein n=1 Tax=uncultured Spongiibacter sp. TaxID=870896 RepID=UPI002588D236|nr:hypothetical protein [uncultured Spongiibacter sp.]